MYEIFTIGKVAFAFYTYSETKQMGSGLANRESPERTRLLCFDACSLTSTVMS